ncbi:D-hexose-6-phosphate mutarotase [Haloferula sp.]|uniref:D-hexose-6-phosphate mutarotase n=1 Tax=Haloferula sp. TaxID=2497595 RepID=UPI00329FDDD9
MNTDLIVSSSEIAPDYPVLEIDHPTCSARVALHGAQVMSWHPKGQEEVIYLSPEAVFREGKAIRGGVPLCWPWFNAHPINSELPSHGFARSQFWDLESEEVDESGVTLKLSLRCPVWTAVVTIQMGQSLSVSFETFSFGKEPLTISGAIHTYLRVGNVGEIAIHGLEDTDYLDTVGDRVGRRQEGPVVIDREVDRIYDSSSSVRLEDPVMKRTIIVEKEGSPSTVVWNPWKEKAAALGDLPDNDYRDFVCVEAAIANDRAVSLEIGDSHCFSTRISIE